MPGGSERRIVKRLSTRAHAAILRRAQERERLAVLVEALSQSIERVIEQDTGVCLDKQDWELNLEAGQIERAIPLKEKQGARPAAE